MMTCPTGTPSVPSAVSSSRTVPSSMLSTSIVALSVSISASTSPDLTVSPTLTSHFDSVPVSIVGDSAGMVMSMGILGSPQLVGSRLVGCIQMAAERCTGDHSTTISRGR